MSRRAAAWLAWSLWMISLVAAISGVVLGILADADLVIVLSVAVLSLVFGATGALVASGLPHNPIGWIFCVLAFVFGVGVLGDAYIAYESQASGFLPGRVWVGWISQWFFNTLAPTLIIFCFLLFPTGSLPSARWRPLIWVVVVVATVHAASVALAPGPLVDYPVENPLGIESVGLLRTLAEVSILVLVIPFMLLSVVSLLVRLRRSSGAERQQLKWFAYAAALLATSVVVGNVLDALFEDVLESEVFELVFFLIFIATLSGIPVAIGVAILKYRLYDIDLLINRTLVYGSLTTILVLFYVSCVVSLQYALRTLTGQESQLTIVASTLAVAALFNPMRRRIQSFIDRRFYRSKYDATKTLDTFNTRLRKETDLDRLNDELVGVVRVTMQPAHVSVWLRPSQEEGANRGTRERSG